MRCADARVAARSPVAGPAAAQTNAERILTDRDTRSHDYDLVHQRIEVWGFDWDSLAFMGRVATTAVSRRSGLDRIVLDAGHLLEVRRVDPGTGLRSPSIGPATR